MADKPLQFTLGRMLVAIGVIAVWLAAAVQWGWSVAVVAAWVLAPIVVIGYSKNKWKTAGNTVGIWLLAGLAVVFLGPFSFLPTHSVSKRSTCQNHIRQVCMALTMYHQRHGSFPPAYTVDDSGRPMHSWRTLILPLLDAGSPYDKIRIDEPWDSQHNRQFHKLPFPLYACPAQQEAKGSSMTDTSYVVVVGPQTVWPGSRAVSMDEIADDAASTLLVVEVINSGIHWMEPRDLHVGQMARTINPRRGQGISSDHPDGANVGFASGHVSFLIQEMDPDQLEAMLTVAGDEDPPPGF